MTDWKLAMLLILPVLVMVWVARGWGWREILCCPRLRCWVVLMGAALCANRFEAGDWQVFMGIDAMALTLTLLHPRRLGQKAIALLFIAMLTSHASFGLLCPPDGVFGYAWFNGVLGWMQFITLAVWSGGNVYGGIPQIRLRLAGLLRGASVPAGNHQ